MLNLRLKDLGVKSISKLDDELRLRFEAKERNKGTKFAGMLPFDNTHVVIVLKPDARNGRVVEERLAKIRGTHSAS